jgi:hypothetical protein
MAQSGKMSSPASPPFATSDGKPAGQGAGSSGAHDFLTEPGAHGDKSGGRNFNTESRPQSEAKKEVEPNPQEIPSGMGGQILRADPSGPAAQAPSGGVQGVTKVPFKSMK